MSLLSRDTTEHAKPSLAMSPEQVAEALSISRAHLFRLVSSGRFPRAIRLGRSVRWERATIEAWLAAGAPPRDRWEELQNSELQRRPRENGDSARRRRPA